ncbi:MAG: SDR family oxidoreductase [Planctomycetaceae bacterium]|nr:SDR family oxidoreductase [Planctomycetaceae bacterium]
MEFQGRVVVVTGGGDGIGAALCRRAAQNGASLVVVSDIDLCAAQSVADEIGGLAVAADVASELQVQQLVEQTLAAAGRLDIFVSNAGITFKGGLDCENTEWQRLWDVNVMSRLYAARACVPVMLRQGEGYLVHTASAAALITEIGSAGYSVTKQADLAMAEWLAIQYGRQGLRVSCVCPLGVQTQMLDEEDPIHRYLHLHVISPEQAADAIVEGIREERFLILPHPEVAEFHELKTQDRDRWIRGMQRLLQKLNRTPRAQV